MLGILLLFSMPSLVDSQACEDIENLPQCAVRVSCSLVMAIPSPNRALGKLFAGSVRLQRDRANAEANTLPRRV